DDPSPARRRAAGGPLHALRIRGGLLGGEADETPGRGQPRQRLTLELPDAPARQVELVPDRFECPRLAIETEAELEDPPLSLGQRVQRPPDTLPPKLVLGHADR